MFSARVIVLASSLPVDGNAWDSDLGRKKPSFPKGILRPCTTLDYQLIVYEKSRDQTYNATHSQEPNNNRERLTELLSIGSLNAVYCNGFKEFETNIYVEDSGYANRAKEPDKDCLPSLVDLVNCSVEGKDNGEASVRGLEYRTGPRANVSIHIP